MYLLRGKPPRTYQAKVSSFRPTIALDQDVRKAPLVLLPAITLPLTRRSCVLRCLEEFDPCEDYIFILSTVSVIRDWQFIQIILLVLITGNKKLLILEHRIKVMQRDTVKNASIFSFDSDSYHIPSFFYDLEGS